MSRYKDDVLLRVAFAVGLAALILFVLAVAGCVGPVGSVGFGGHS